MEMCDPTITPEEYPRLAKQCEAILDRLKEGPATNQELAQIALKYTGRISDLRENGYDIRLVSRDRKRGVTVYRLETA